MELNLTSPPSLQLRHLWPIADQIDLARSQAPARSYRSGVASFVSKTKIETPHGEGRALIPFVLWSAQADVLTTMELERLLVILKARQLGISWLSCAYALHGCVTQAGYMVLLLSQGQLEANELIHRIGVLARHHADRVKFPDLITDNTGELEWSNGSRVLSLAATRRAGRSFTAALVILDEWAFMQWPTETLAAVKPTIDAGGKLFIISSADGSGTPYHQFWQAAERGSNGYAPVFLPWTARPDRGPGWREQKVIEASGDTASVLREYPINPIEAFTHAVGLIYDVWSDGPDDGNVTEAAEYEAGDGPVYWAVDDGYEGMLDPIIGQYTVNSAPRVFLLVQERANGRLCVFDEDYACKLLSEAHIDRVQAKGYPDPVYAAVDSAAAELRGRMSHRYIHTLGKPQSIEESIKVTRRMLAKDENGRRRILVHPRCKHLRFEMASYRRGVNGVPIDALNHGPDALRYIAWTRRREA